MMSQKTAAAVFLLAVIVSGCVSRPAVPAKQIPVGEPPPAGLLFIGVSAVLSSREASIRLALEEAARRVAIYHSVAGEFTSNQNIGSGALDFSQETRASIQYDDGYKRFVDSLIFDPETDIRTINNSIFVYVRYAAPVPPDIPYPVSLSEGSAMPAWALNPPAIPGYIVGIGYAGRRAAHRDTVNISYENAVYSALRNVSSSIEGSASNSRDSGIRYNSSAGGMIRTAGTLEGFYALDFWVDPSTQAVWTLAVAKPGGD
ncbi:MAG: hypothetical protein LBK08_13925 [Treponema sp.]|jgi:hypothetical protein|nr:hypothetical protein [Treponema sp.]